MLQRLFICKLHACQRSVLQCVAVCYSVLWCSMLQCVAVYCSVLQCVEVCCNALGSRTLQRLLACMTNVLMQCVSDSLSLFLLFFCFCHTLSLPKLQHTADNHAWVVYYM